MSILTDVISMAGDQHSKMRDLVRVTKVFHGQFLNAPIRGSITAVLARAR
jgi:hypothetical protein